jgi:hypothetical protein
MLLARAAVRQKEMAIRTALGAGRYRVIRQFLTESVLLAFAGAGAGMLLAVWGVRALVALSPTGIPRVETITLDGAVLLLMLAVSVLTGLAFGLVPALRSSTVDLNDSLKEGGRGSTETIRRNRFRSLLVASEFALALILLVGAGLMIRSLLALQAIDPGFNPHNLLTMVVTVTGSQAGQPAQRAPFYQRLLQQVRALAGVQSASAINQRLPPCRHLIEHGAERKDVAAAVNILSERLFRRHVGNRAQRCARAGEVLEIDRGRRRFVWRRPLNRPDTRGTLSPKGTKAALAQKTLPRPQTPRLRSLQFCQPEIQDLRLAARGGEDIRRLDIAMGNALAVGRV